jgi:hypothetical protein
MTTSEVMAASDLQAPTELGQVFLQDEQRLPINPAAIISGKDGLIVVGSSNGQAWAAKTDIGGKALWTYRLSRSSDVAPGGFLRSIAPEFNCAATMGDGTVWLVGSTVDAAARVGLLVHLDRNGKLLSNRMLRPVSPAAQGSPVNLLLDCAGSGSGITIVGSTLVKNVGATAQSTADPTAPKPSPWSPAFWVLVVDTQGRSTFEEVIPTGRERGLGGSKADMALLRVGSRLVVSAKTGADTELLALDLDGRSRGSVQKHYPNAFLSLVRPVIPDTRIQLIGTFLEVDSDAPSGTSFSVALITLNEHLDEMQRQLVQTRTIPNITYRMPDQSLAIFGAETHRVGEQYTSQIGRADANLRDIRTLNPSRATFSDAGMINAAAPCGPIGRFVAASVAVVHGFPEHPSRIERFPEFIRGAALEFFQVGVEVR